MSKAVAAEQGQTKLSNLKAPAGSRKTGKRKGRGIGSGLGKRAGRGQKGQTSRRGSGRTPGFEGGQTPLHRRIPKFGFKNLFRQTYAIVNLSVLDSFFENGDTVDPEKMKEKRLVRSNGDLVKILGNGNLTKNLTVKAHKFSKSAIQKINKAGGSVEEIKLGKR